MSISTISTPVYCIFGSLKNGVLDIQVKSPQPRSKMDLQLLLYIKLLSALEISLVALSDDPGPESGMFGSLLFHTLFL
jgi:hypothetical protein